MATGFPAPSLSILYEGQLLNRTDGEVGIGRPLAERVQVRSEEVVMVDNDGLSVVVRALILFNPVDADTGNFTCIASTDIPGIGMRSDSVTFELTVLGKS